MGGPTLTRFFSLHFLIPILIIFIVVLHLIFLHEKGRTSQSRVVAVEGVPFHPFFIVKDLYGLSVVLVIFFGFCFLWPEALSEPQNFIPANPLITPPHIQPE